jgi:hypothetical protein
MADEPGTNCYSLRFVGRWKQMAPRDGSRPGWVELPTIGDDGSEELPYAALAPDDIKEPIVPTPRRSWRSFSRPVAISTGIVVAVGLLAAAVAFAWPSSAPRRPTTTVAATDQPVTTTTVAPTQAFLATARPDGWFDVASGDGAIHLQLPAQPKLQSTNGEGTAFLVGDLGGGARAELLWAPITTGQPRTLAPYLAMSGAMDRYPGIQGSPMRTSGGTSIIDGTRTTSADRLSARVTETAHFAFLVLLVEPASMGKAAEAAMWSRILGSLSVTP